MELINDHHYSIASSEISPSRTNSIFNLANTVPSLTSGLKRLSCRIFGHWTESPLESYKKNGNFYTDFKCNLCGRVRTQMWDLISDI